MNENKRTKNVKQNKAIDNMGNSTSIDAIKGKTNKVNLNNNETNK